MSFLAKLKYVEEEIPRKPLNKRKLTPTDADKKAKSKKYEATRPEGIFNISWQKDRPWLNYDEEKIVTTHSMCIKLPNRNLTYMTNNPSPKSSNPFLNGCSNFKTSKMKMTFVRGFCMKMLIGNLLQNMLVRQLSPPQPARYFFQWGYVLGGPTNFITKSCGK